MALTPEEIEGRRFPLVARGYDPKQVDRFLTEVAASYRYAMHHLLPGVHRHADTSTSGDGGHELHQRVSAEVADILRAAERVGESLRSEADQEAAEIRSAAAADAARIRAEADQQRQQAKKALLRAQQQAETLVREAERQAEERLALVEAEAEQRAHRVLAGVRRRAEQMVRAEQAAVERLRAVRDEIDTAIVRVAGSETEPVVDLTSGEPVVRIGDFPPGAPSGREPEDSGSAADTDSTPEHRHPSAGREHPHLTAGTPSDRDVDEERERDSLRRMVRAAVLRAAEHAAADADHPGPPARQTVRDQDGVVGRQAVGTPTGHPSASDPGDSPGSH
ncbi:DivIVA domain-containing protein [Rhabdothermincola sediminis]|uniref:DivIVA domain-containing protein n=1 Tax=Rhabdothermincola sediminis TaxID=2751370 RepID=UPI001AA0A05F|nr:DivIVA domain-containing protein [Rhabdothermincola sediminis]